MAARKRDAARKTILAADDVPGTYAGWMCATETEEHFQEGGAKAEAYIRGVAKRLRGAEVFEVTGKNTTKREALAIATERGRTP